MIRLFKNNETDFSHNETVLSEVISCKIIEEINEDYTMELEYPLEDTKNISSNLVTASIISTPTIDSRDNQQFRIIQKETNSNSITVQSQSKLLADLKENRIRAVTIVGKTRKEAIQIILNSALDPHNYKVGNLDTNVNTNVILEVKEGNLLSAIIGSENSVLSEYGGEFIVSNETIDIVDQRGEDNGVVIEYGKNISSIKETIDNTDLATVLIPKSGDYRLPEYQIVSPNAGAYEKKYYRDVELNLNIWDGTNTKDEKQITVEEAYKIMRDTCNKMFNEDKVDQITFSYVIDFIELSKTEEYKNYKALESVKLGDTVYIKHKKLNLDLQGRINKISYTVDSEGNTTIDKVEIGFARKNITDIISDTVKQIQFAKQEIVLQVSNSEKKINARIDLQEEKIDAVVEQDGTGMGWELSKNAFKVACVGASGAYVIIDVNGLEVHDGKFRLYKDSKLVFYVNANGRCTADGGFVVDDGDANYKLDKNGLSMTNENGYTSRIYVAEDSTTLVADDDFQITNTLDVKDSARFRSYSKFYADVDFDTENINIGSKTLKEYIESVVNNM